MTLLASFNHPVADAQRAFRRILKAMSEPGVMVSLPLQQGWGALSPAATALLLTLVDQESPVWLDAEIDNEQLRNNLRFHTGAPITTQQDAPFALSHAAAQLTRRSSQRVTICHRKKHHADYRSAVTEWRPDAASLRPWPARNPGHRATAA